MSFSHSDLKNVFPFHVRTFNRWCKAGKIPGAYRTKGGHWRCKGTLTTRIVLEIQAKFTKKGRQKVLGKYALDISPNLARASKSYLATYGFHNPTSIFEEQMPDEWRETIFETPISEVLTPQFLNACNKPSLPLHLAARAIVDRSKRLNLEEDLKNPKWCKNAKKINTLTAISLAKELKIGRATLYRKYSQIEIKNAIMCAKEVDEIRTDRIVTGKKCTTNWKDSREQQSP